MGRPAPLPASAAHVQGDFCAGEWLIQPGLGLVSRDNVPVHLEPKTMEVLVALAEHAGETVSKDALVRAVWPDTFVSEHVLTHAIWQLRQAFGEEEMIQTVPRRGYRLAAEVRPATTGMRSLAVLPLANLTGDPQQEYFADGMTEALISVLAQIGALRVISRTSAMQYKNSTKPLPQIAAELNVGGVVEGSVVRAGERVRISVQLIHGATDEHVWARTYDAELRDVLSLQDEMAREIATEIKVTLTESEERQLARTRKVVPESHEAYLKGRFCHARASEEGLRMSIALMHEAIAIDPGYARAYAGLADSIALLASPVAEAIPPAEANRMMEPAVERALQLDPALADAHFLAGWIKVYYEWRWTEAEEAFRRALALNPNYSMAYAGLGTVYEALGKHDKAIGAWTRACELDPLSLLNNVLLGWTLVLAGRAEAAVEQLRKALRMEPNYWFAREVMGLAQLGTGRSSEAVQEVETAVRLAPEPFPKGVLGHVYGRVGRAAEARGVLRELEDLSRRRYVAPSLLAYVHAGLGEMEQAWRLMEQALEARDPSLIWTKSLATLWGKPLAGDERYQRLLTRMGLAGGE